MPVQLSYPGVYIEEIPSGVRTIAGVATSIAAFVGWAAKGPTDRAELILSWLDYERKFGGLNPQSLLSYSVYQFFANGGRQAYVIRLVANASHAAVSAAFVADKGLNISAKNEGVWSRQYGVTIKMRTDAENTDRFTLSVVLLQSSGPGVVVESFDNLSANQNDSRFVKNVVNAGSSIINVTAVTSPPANPSNTIQPEPLAGGSDGTVLDPQDPTTQVDFENALNQVSQRGIFYLDKIDIFNLLCVPGESNPTVINDLQKFCRDRRAFLIVDPPQTANFGTFTQNPPGPNTVMTGTDAINSAFYFPWVLAPDALQGNRPREFPPCGFIAGIYARTDADRGVWKAPAGTEASLTGVIGVKEVLTDLENGVLNLQAINCIRSFAVYGTVAWGARTLQGNEERGSEWKYIPVRRTALFLEESLYRGLKWVVFEPNDEPLWAQIRLNVGAFMHRLFRQGAFQGRSPQEAYFVKCDKETTTQDDINRGIVNILVGFAPLKPAEFVVIKIQQKAGEIQT